MAQALRLFPEIETKSADEGATPLMAQYLKIKREYADYLLFFRLGDFYELFFDDAVAASAALDIALTKRGKHQDKDIPMCGVPWHQSETYLSRLINKGFRVAICEQAGEIPSGKPGKTIIERKVVRVITPGTVTEENLLQSKRNNFMLSVAETQGQYALAWIDLSTGEFYLRDCDKSSLANLLSAIEPGEIILPEKIMADADFAALWKNYAAILSVQPNSRFHADGAEARLQRLYNVQTLDGFAAFSRPALAASGALVDYIELTQIGALPILQWPRLQQSNEFLQIDGATARNLELRRRLDGEYTGSFLSCIDRTITGAGARMLDTMLSQPLTDVAAINARLDVVECFKINAELRKNIRAQLRLCPDMQRALSRISLNRGSPRDLAALRDGLLASLQVKILLRSDKNPNLLNDVAADLGDQNGLQQKLAAALAAELPIFTRDGNFIAAGYSTELDYLRQLRDESQRLIAGLQQDYIRKTGVANLKIRHNNILGYYIEVPPKSADKMGADFIHRQTLATAARYTTSALNEMEQKISKAAAQALAMELQIFDELVGLIKNKAGAIQSCAAAMAALDVYTALALLAEEENYIRPTLTDDLSFAIAGGRHPVVEQSLRTKGQGFIANDCQLQKPDGQLWLITGPNMAGKSTYLRQNALIAIMAQMGSFVPASQCTIGVTDKIFSRVGAADDLARGQSTFMVEMVETATILHQATVRSLVILDEIGRGTATFDGLSIAWAVLEYLHDKTLCRGLFATHYHELTELQSRLDHLACYTMRVKEWEGEIVFLHEITKGAAEHSYGIHVAKLAGLPGDVIVRADHILHHLEQQKIGGEMGAIPEKSTIATPIMPDHIMALVDELSSLAVDDLSPRAALDHLDRLKKMAMKK
ncbi:MAG: DNA mismatch repair protein MutS [Alphaproteobacteria bacterium]|nr:MAG: DNA mismatch repair protein MutS [Alphaproteobacteria bacterium]